MRIVLIGRGAEDVRSPLGSHMAFSLRSLGHEVFVFDPTEAARLQTRGQVQDQIQWIFRTTRPHRLIWVPSDPEVDELVRETSREHSVAQLAIDVPEVATYVFDGAVPLHAAVHPDLSNLSNLSNTPNEPPIDVLVLGPADPQRAEVVRTLLNAGRTVRCVGEGWDDHADIRQVASGPRALTALHRWIDKPRSCLVLAARGTLAALDVGPIHAALTAAVNGLPLVIETGCGLESYFGDEHVQFVERPAMVDAIGRLLSDDDANAQRAKRATEHVRAHWSWQQQWHSLLAFDEQRSDEPGSDDGRVVVRRDGPTVSYIWPMYNAEAFIGAAIESVLQQTYQDLELVIYDDGSTDNSASVVEKYTSDQRLHFLRGANVGQTGRFDFLLNVVSRQTRGEYVSLLGADDIAFPERTQKSLAIFADDPGVDVVHTGAVLINEHDEALGAVFELDFSYDTTSMLRRLLIGNSVASPTFFMRRSFIEQLGWWGGGFATDYNFWLRAARVGRFRFIPECLMAYRQHGSNASIGAGANASANQALITRLPERQHTALADMYPALRSLGADDRAWAAAYVDVGNGHLRFVPAVDAALSEYARALQCAPHDLRPLIDYNAALATINGGDESGYRSIERLMGESEAVAARVKAAEVLTPFDARELSDAPFVLPLDLARRTICWDGTPASQRRILMVPDWSRIDAVRATITTYLSLFSADDEIDLVIPTLGLSVEDTMARVHSSLPVGEDLSTAAELTLETWDNLVYLPMDRFAMIVNHYELATVAALESFMRERSQALRPTLPKTVRQ